MFHIRGVEDTIAGISFETFTSVYHMERTVERAVAIISEAVKSLPTSLLAECPDIERRRIISIGNLLRHEYEQVDPEVMWNIATVHLPAFEGHYRKNAGWSARKSVADSSLRSSAISASNSLSLSSTGQVLPGRLS